MVILNKLLIFIGTLYCGWGGLRDANDSGY